MQDFKPGSADRYEEGARGCMGEAEKHPVGSDPAMFWIAKGQLFATLMIAAATRGPVAST
jgi:hypothetical protein